MDTDILPFLKRLSLSILTTVIWLSINAIAAIKGDNAFIGERITLANIIFYLWLIISGVLLVYFYKKIWRK